MYETPLLRLHEELGASIGEFAGWRVPMDYGSALEEHMAVRRGCGVFDVSHMGRIRLRGPDVIPFIQLIYTKNLEKTKEMWMSGPTLALNQWARVKDDEMLYRVSDEEWLLVANAAYREKMLRYFNEIKEARGFRVEIEDLTMKTAMIAVQGPSTVEIMEKIGAGWLGDLKTLEFRMDAEIAGEKFLLVSRSGWTGEDGFEIWGEPGAVARLFRRLLEAGAKPAGIISRDSLRIEMGFVLGEHEYGEDPSRYPPANSLRYGLGAIDWGKHGFIGEEMLRAYRREGVRWIRIGIKMKKKHARIVPRQGYKLYVEDQVVGWVTSGTWSPVKKRGVGIAYIDTRYNIPDDPVMIEVRGKLYEAKITDFPLI